MDKLISKFLLAHRDALMSGQFHLAQQVQKKQDEARNANVADMGWTQTSWVILVVCFLLLSLKQSSAFF